MKYIDAGKLKYEIERLKRSVELNREHYNNIPLESRNELDAYYAQELILNSLIDTIDSLQQEQSEVDLEKELEEEIARYLREECSADDEPSISDIARHFAEWGATHLKK